MGATAAAVIAVEERQIVEAYRSARAVNPRAARSPSDVGVHQNAAFARLVSRAVLRDAGGGSYYLDESSWEAQRGARRRIVIVAGVAAIIVVLLVVGILLTRVARS